MGEVLTNKIISENLGDKEYENTFSRLCSKFHG